MVFVVGLFAGILLTLAVSVIVFHTLMILASSIGKKSVKEESPNGNSEHTSIGS